MELRLQSARFYPLAIDKKKDTWYVYGAGGLGVETMDILLELRLLGKLPNVIFEFVVDQPKTSFVAGIPVTAYQDCLPGGRCTIGVGEPSVRQTLKMKALEKGLRLSSVVSKRAFVSDSAVIEDGAVVAPFASIQSFARVGSNVSVNTQAIIGHHVQLHDDAVISSQVNLGGGSIVGKSSYIGMGALVLEKVKIGDWAIVGMGSVVYKDIPDRMVALGSPARVVRKNEKKTVFK